MLIQSVSARESSFDLEVFKSSEASLILSVLSSIYATFAEKLSSPQFPLSTTTFCLQMSFHCLGCEMKTFNLRILFRNCFD